MQGRRAKRSKVFCEKYSKSRPCPDGTSAYAYTHADADASAYAYADADFLLPGGPLKAAAQSPAVF